MSNLPGDNPEPLSAPEPRPKGLVLSRLDLLALGLVVAIALVLRLVNLGSFPDSFNPDEADNFQDAMSNLYGEPRANGFFGFDWKPQPAYSIYMLSAFIKLLGPSVTAMRLPSALLSVLALVPFFLLLRRRFSTVASGLATLLLGTNLWYLNFSRSAWENVHVALYMLSAMLFLMLALDRIGAPIPGRRTWLYFALSGVFCALGLYGYFGGRAIVLAVAAYFPVALWFYRRRWRAVVLGFLLTGAMSTLLFLPELLYILANWEFFNTRSSVVVIFGAPEFAADPFGVLWGQISRNAAGTLLGGISIPRYLGRYTPLGEPLLDPATGSLVLVGIVLSIFWTRMRRRPENLLWWIMLLVSWILTEVLTRDTPDAARGVGWLPTLFYFTAASFEIAVLMIRGLPPAGQRIAVGLVAGCVLLISAWNVNRYVAWQADPNTRALRHPYIETALFAGFASEVQSRLEKNRSRVTWDEWQTIKQLDLTKIRQDKPNLRLTELQRWPINARVDEPLGIAYLGGNVYMADFRAGSLGVLDTSTGRYSAFQADTAQGEIKYTRPGDIDVGPDNLLYVLNNGPEAQALLVMRPTGEVVRQVTLDMKTAIAIGIDVTADGSIYVSDKLSGVVLKYGPEGGEVEQYWLPANRLNNSTGLLVDEAGSIFVADTGNRAVQQFDARPAHLRTIEVGCPPLFLASRGESIELSCAGQILSIDTEEWYTTVAEVVQGAPLRSPAGITYAPDGTLFVRDGAELIRYKVER